MITINKDEYIFEVDLEGTKAYYQSHSICECDKCTHYYRHIKGRFPKLEEFLSEFGVDISKPDNIFSAEAEDSIEYLNVDYTVCGNIETMGQYEIDLSDRLFLSVIVTEGYACPNEQTGPYFTLSVVGVTLPWDSHKSQLKPEAENRKQATSLFDKIKCLFTKKQKHCTPTKPTAKPKWDAIVEALYDQNLDAFDCEVVRVIYSKDRSVRYVILRDENGRYTYEIEAIYQWYDNEWDFLRMDDDTLPARWEPFHGRMGNSFFESEADLLRELMAEPEYTLYFQTADEEEAQ